MSDHVREEYLENKFEEGLSMGLTEEEAEVYAYSCLEEDAYDDYDGQPDEAQEWYDFDPDC